MQKLLRKPENWQDFESLLKKLWGELWEIPHKIKKNGRLGQPQNGVDVYGIPKNDEEYWGIQCKGKNDYVNSVLDEKEINREIDNAKSFSPKLKVFIIATTQSKDSKIEQYVRERDLESRKNGGFEIILFCWEDIVDLIEDNRETINWYLGVNNFREKYDVRVCFSNRLDFINVEPKFLKQITKYRNLEAKVYSPQIFKTLPVRVFGQFEQTEKNHSWCDLEIFIENTGNVVLENWHLNLKMSNVQKISDGFNVNIWLNSSIQKMMHEQRTLYSYDDENRFLFEPAKNEPLIQKSQWKFNIKFIPEFSTEEINLEWELFARDFDKSGTLKINLNPIFEEEIIYNGKEGDDKEDSIEILQLIKPTN